MKYAKRRQRIKRAPPLFCGIPVGSVLAEAGRGTRWQACAEVDGVVVERSKCGKLIEIHTAAPHGI